MASKNMLKAALFRQDGFVGFCPANLNIQIMKSIFDFLLLANSIALPSKEI